MFSCVTVLCSIDIKFYTLYIEMNFFSLILEDQGYEKRFCEDMRLLLILKEQIKIKSITLEKICRSLLATMWLLVLFCLNLAIP